MSAFNKRYTPTHVMGQPMYAVLSLVISLVALVLTLVFPIITVKFIFGIIGVIGLLSAALFFRLADDVSFLGVKIQNWIDKHQSMSYERESE